MQFMGYFSIAEKIPGSVSLRGPLSIHNDFQGSDLNFRREWPRRKQSSGEKGHPVKP